MDALPPTPPASRLAPIYCAGVTETSETFLCQLSLGLDLEDPPFLAIEQGRGGPGAGRVLLS